MPSAVIKKAKVFEDGGAQCMARIVGQSAAYITQASLTSITCKVFSRDGTNVSTPTITISTSVFDTLQTDDRWDEDSTGYNFRHTVAASVLTTGNETYRIEYKFTPVSGEVFFVVFELSTINVLTS